MAARIDHVAIPCREPEGAAQFLAGLLGLAIDRDGPDDEFPCVVLDAGARLLFQPSAQVAAHHIAFCVDLGQFAALVSALRARSIPHGNDPEAPTNQQVTDPLGGAGRVYFRDPDGHLYEACC